MPKIKHNAGAIRFDYRAEAYRLFGVDLTAKLGPKAATTATAHKLAVIFYTLVTKRMEYDESVWATHELENRKRMEHRIKRQASRLGFQLVPVSVPVEVPQ